MTALATLRRGARARDSSGPKRRVLFIQPGFARTWGTDFTYKELLPHIGLAYVAAAARRAGHAVHVIDGHADGATVTEVVERARAFGPDVFAFTANSMQMGIAIATARALREAFPTVPIVLGGYHVSPIPVETLEEFADFDYAVFGEAEETIVELLAAIDGAETRSLIPGVAMRSGGGIVRGPDRGTVADLDDLPRPAFDLFPRHLYYAPYTFQAQRSLTLTTARGCPYRCVFCQNPGGLKYRYRDMEAVLDEVGHDIQVHGSKLLFLTDETFTLNRKRAMAFCEGILRRGYQRHLGWSCETRVDSVDRELLALMQRAGCYAIFYGVESGSQTILDAAKKRISKDEAVEAVRRSRELGIFTHTGFIFGHPFETHATIHETIDFALAVDSDACSFSVMIPFPGTEVRAMAEAGVGGLKLLATDWKAMQSMVGSALELEGLPRAEIERLQLYAYARFYSRPRKWTNFFKTGRAMAIPVVLGHIASSQVRSLVASR